VQGLEAAPPPDQEEERRETMKKNAKSTLVRKDVIAFLKGQGPLDGVWFGDVPTDRLRYWWRDYLPPRRPTKKKKGGSR
jgi:hypothetical protein